MSSKRSELLFHGIIEQAQNESTKTYEFWALLVTDRKWELKIASILSHQQAGFILENKKFAETFYGPLNQKDVKTFG